MILLSRQFQWLFGYMHSLLIHAADIIDIMALASYSAMYNSIFTIGIPIVLYTTYILFIQI